MSTKANKILIVEDNEDVRENLAEIIELAGFEVVTAENGVSGVSKAISDPPDLILCDVMMPELDGFGVLKILNKNPKTYDIPFIFLTAKTEKTDFRKGMGLGADDYITKPFDDVELLEAIETRLKKSTRLRNAFDKTETGLQRFIDEAKAKEEFQKLSLDKEYRRYQKKDLVYEQGQYPKWLFFISEGKVKEYYTNDFGKELITNIYAEGDFFGYIPLLMDAKYKSSTMALEDCMIRMIPKEDFNMLLFNNRNFSAQFIKMLANQTSDVEKQLIELAYSSVRKKVANALLVLREKEQNVSFSILREDLASLAGTAKETVIRTISDFKTEGLLDIKDNIITLTDVDGLKSMPQ
jgi:DNA-binding response OmpR family regulator